MSGKEESIASSSNGEASSQPDVAAALVSKRDAEIVSHAERELSEADKAVVAEKERKNRKAREDTMTAAQRRLEQMNLRFNVQDDRSALLEKHAFWDTQPVPHMSDSGAAPSSGAIDRVKTVEEIRKEPLPLPAEYEWIETNIDDDVMMRSIYQLLCEHYVEDDDNMFRFAYPINFLHWALKPPGFRREWHIGVRVKASGKLVAFITAIPVEMSAHGQVVRMVEINFLCIHKKLRAHRLAPVLIKEITRRVNLTNVWQAVYTAGKVIPTPVGTCQYWHRSLNPQKLIDVRFSAIPPQFHKFSDPMKMTKKFYSLPEKTNIPGFRRMEPRDVRPACALVSAHLEKFKLHPIFSEEEFAHWCLSRDGVIDSFVVENPARPGEITDFCSFYTLPSTVIGHPVHKALKAAYSFYNTATSVSLTELMNNALIMAAKLNFDVFNGLDLMDNAEFLKDLKFGPGDGHLHYYFFNWRCPEVDSGNVGLVML